MDPAKTWLYHSIKAMIACTIAGLIALHRYDFSSIWIFFPTTIFMLTVDVDEPLWYRIRYQVALALVSFIAVSAMIFLFPFFILKTILFLTIVVVAAYFSYKSNAASMFGYSVIAFSFMAYVFPKKAQAFSGEIFGFCTALGICLLVTFFIFPERLSTQLNRRFQITTDLLGRYIIFVVADSMRGNISLPIRDENLQRVLDIQKKNEDIFDKITAEKIHVKQYEEVKKTLVQLKQTLYLAIAVENSLYLLSQQALFRGPFTEGYGLLRSFQKSFEKIRQKEYEAVDYGILLGHLEKMEMKIHTQMDNLKQRSEYLHRDYQQWLIVSYNLRQFVNALQALGDFLREVRNVI